MDNTFDIQKEKVFRDSDYENKIRPIEFRDFKGQEKIIENLIVFVQAAILRGDTLDHVLLHGSSGIR